LNATMEPKEPKTRKRMKGVGIVKAVSSGDSLTVMGGMPTGPNGFLLSEKQITLSNILAPKIARKFDQKDADFAFASREYLRHFCIGKQVTFYINMTRKDGNTDRNYADVEMDGYNLAEYMLKGGYATVKMPVEGKSVHPDRQHLVDMMQIAKEQKRGMFASLSNQIRDINYTPDPRTLFEASKGRSISAIVEKVREGHVFRLELLGKNLAHQVITLHLAGVECPKIPRTDSKEVAEPFAEEARFYSEARLLNRDVKVNILAVDKMGNFFGSIDFEQKDRKNAIQHHNIAVNLLSNGLAKIVSWTAVLTGQEAKLNDAQNLARARHAKLWKDAKPVEDAIEPEYQATVVYVHGGDSLSVERTSGTTEKKKINVASIKCPRLGRQGTPDEPLAMEAREFVRSRLIGKKVLIVPEYLSRQQGQGKPVSCCTVRFVEGVEKTPSADLGQKLLAAGLAQVVRHAASEPRSRNYNELILAEESAIRAAKGMFAKKVAVPVSIIDYSFRDVAQAEPAKEVEAAKTAEPAPKADAKAASFKKPEFPKTRARTFLPYLQRGGELNGVVEHVFHSTRLKVYIPSENAFISLSLAGIRAPENKQDATDGSNQVATTATQYTTSKLVQRTVKIKVDSLDLYNNFIGACWFNKINWSVHLASKGYASVHAFSAGKTEFKQELLAAQAEAREKKEGIWLNWVKTPTPPASEGEEGEEQEKRSPRSPRQPFRGGDRKNANDRRPDRRPIRRDRDRKGEQSDDNLGENLTVKITEINDTSNFFVTISKDKNAPKVEEGMKLFNEAVPPDQITLENLEAGKLYGGLFPLDNLYYRVRVEGKANPGYLRCMFVDFGNRTELALTSIRALPKDLEDVAPLARSACLAGVVASFNPEYKDAAIKVFGELCFERELRAKLELKDKNNKLHLSLFDTDSSVSINLQLAKAGTVRVVERPNVACLLN